AGTVRLSDASGRELLAWEVPCSFSSVILSCPELAPGKTYTLEAGGQSEELTPDAVSASLGVPSGMHGRPGAGPPKK
ncbi:MAG: methionine adenosyltransferase, partial [Lachnospiraceae bacterium]|nr:methionine adenosyltransferase [Lachnospiraceae bacterium]